MNLEPKESQYPIKIDTTSGPCTVLRYKQMYQHIQLQLTWHETGGVDLMWITLADNCEDNFELCGVDGLRTIPDNVHKLLRHLAKRWIAHWETKTGY